MEKHEKALERFENGFNCSQSMFSVFAEELEMDLKEALRVSTAFGGGIVGTGCTCGIITGGLMALGLKHGKDNPSDDEAKANTYELGKTFIKRIQELHGNETCNGLLGCDITTNEGKTYKDENNLKEKVCKKVLADAVKLLEAMI